MVIVSVMSIYIYIYMYIYIYIYIYIKKTKWKVPGTKKYYNDGIIRINYYEIKEKSTNTRNVEISEGQSDSENRRRTYNTMAKRKRTKGSQTTK
jgi:hypothetical protein